MHYRRELDGLRAVALLPVMFFHAGLPGFAGGFVGLDVFFVLSGYLITSIILTEQAEGNFSLLRFYERRARRILPALFVIIGLCMVYAHFTMMPGEMYGFVQSVITSLLFVSNQYFAHDQRYFAASSQLMPLLHTWSLSVEGQFYLLFPLLMFLLRGRKAAALWAIAALALASFELADRAPAFSLSYFWFTARAWELLAGCLAAYWLFYVSPTAPHGDTPLLAQAASLGGLALIMMPLCILGPTTPYPGRYTLIAVAGTLLILRYANLQTLAGRLLGLPPLVGLGLVSYSTYLWHQPLFAFARLGSMIQPSPMEYLLLVAASVALACVSWKYIERPFRNRHRIGPRPFASAALCLLILLLMACNVILSRHSIAAQSLDRPTEDKTAVHNRVEPDMVRTFGCWKKFTVNQTLDSTCVLGNPQAPMAVALMGDSHAGSLANALDDALRNKNLAGHNYSYVSCPPLLNGADAMHDASRKPCQTMRQLYFTYPNDNPKTLILFARWTLLIEHERFNNGEGGIEYSYPWFWEFDGKPDVAGERTAAEYATTVRFLLSKGHRVILVYPTPEVGWYVADLLKKQPSPVDDRVLSTSFDRFQERARRTHAALDAIGTDPNLVRIRPEKLFCNTYVPNRCVTQLGGVPLYGDTNHLSYVGAQMIVKEIMKHVSDTP